MRCAPIPMTPPPGMGTERFRRFWAWMRDCGTGLGSFSTDEGLYRALPDLREIERELAERFARSTAPGAEGYVTDTEKRIAREVLADLRAVMARAPSARETTATARRATENKGTASFEDVMGALDDALKGGA